jgi:dTDP-4-amino-4,6-dideoxygalactose transaminase
MKIPISKSIFTKEDMDNVLEPLHNGWVVQGPKVEEFEKMWCHFTNSKFSIATTSCTSSLFLSLAALELDIEDEVIVPALSWISTANVVENLGCKTVFCDIDLSTFNINLEDLKSKITKKTKAIIPVHLFGYPIDVLKIKKIIGKKDIHIIEDSACGFGSYIKNVHVGITGSFGCFSFHPRKAITTGEGGMITTNNQHYAIKLRALRDHGMDYSNNTEERGPHLMKDHLYAGYNYRMTDIQAALGISQMKRSSNILQERREIAKRYDEAFHNNNFIGIPVYNSNESTHSYQSYVCLYKPLDIEDALRNEDFASITRLSEERNTLMKNLANDGIGTRPPTHAIHVLDYYSKKYKLLPQDFPKAWTAFMCGFSLPIFPGLSHDDQKMVIISLLKNLI